MSSKQSTVDFILEQMADAGAMSAKKMFGEYGLYRADQLIGLVCDDQLFIKPTPGGRSFIGENRVEAAPYHGAKPSLLIPGETWEDNEWLARLVKITAAELPSPKKKALRRPTIPKPAAL